MKVAFCYSGMFRDFVDNIDNHIENLISGYDSDVYLSFWDIKGNGNFRNPVNVNDSKTIYEEEQKQVLEKLNPKFVEYEHFLPMERLFKNIELERDNVRDAPPFMRNILSMYYKIKRCGDVVESSGIDYDLVVRLRSDLHFNEKIQLEPMKPNTVAYNNFGEWNWSNSFDDKFFYGDLQTMNEVKNLYENLDNVWDLAGLHYGVAPETLFYKFLEMRNFITYPVKINYNIT